MTRVENVVLTLSTIAAGATLVLVCALAAIVWL
jgi:hypothetical protein